MAASDKAGAKSGARGRRGRQPRQKRNLIGTEDEVSNRQKAMLLWDPEKTFPEFKQIRPNSESGRSVFDMISSTSTAAMSPESAR